MPPPALKICMVTTFYPPYHFGGDAIYVYRLVEALATQGHRVDVIHSCDAYHLQNTSGPATEFSHHPAVNRCGLTSQRPMASTLAAHQLGRPSFYARQVREILESGRYDVIHFHNVSLVGGPGILRYGRAVKLYSPHEYWLICPTHALFTFDREACTKRRCLRCTLHARRPPQLWRYTRWLRRCLEHIDCMLPPSHFALERHRAEGIDRPMVHLPYLVPSGPPRTSEAEALHSDEPFFLFTGRLEKLKGLQDLISVFAEYHGARLVIVGEGSYESTLRDQASGFKHITFQRSVHPSELVELYRRAIAVVAPSLCYETFGLSVAEALAQGTPAVVRRIGALAELIEVSAGGLTFESPGECRQALESLQHDATLRATLGERGRQAAQRLWSTEAHLERYFNVIESIRAGRIPAA